MILTCTVTSLVITVAVVLSLCPTPLNSPRGDINSPRGRATFHPNTQYPEKIPIFPSEIQFFLTNYPIKSPPFPNKLPIVPQMPNFLQILICPSILNIPFKIPIIPPRILIFPNKYCLPLNSQWFSHSHKLLPQTPTFPPSLLNLLPKFPLFLKIPNFLLQLTTSSCCSAGEDPHLSPGSYPPERPSVLGP